MRPWCARNRQLLLAVGRVGGKAWPGLCSLYLCCLPFGTLSLLRFRKGFWEVCHWSLLGSLSMALSFALASPLSPGSTHDCERGWGWYLALLCPVKDCPEGGRYLGFPQISYRWSFSASASWRKFLVDFPEDRKRLKWADPSCYLFIDGPHVFGQLWGETPTLSWVWSFSKT